MTHLGERLTDFVFGELPVTEMEETRRHLAACADCRSQVEQFERTRSLLKMSPDVEPPRHMVFEFEKPRTIWQWLVPAMAAAALIMAVLVALPMQIQWHNSQLTVSFGRIPAAVPVPAPVALTADVAQAAPQSIDYDRIANQVNASERAWLVEELKKHDAEQMMRIQILQGTVAYLKSEQEAIDHNTVTNSADIQKLVQRIGLAETGTGAQ